MVVYYSVTRDLISRLSLLKLSISLGVNMDFKRRSRGGFATDLRQWPNEIKLER